MGDELDGYWPSPWPAEDGGPTRRQTPAVDAHFTLDGGTPLRATSRDCFGANMVVLREPGEAYLQGNTFGAETTSWVERIDPVTLEPVVRSPDLAGGPFWAGGLAAHRNGRLYVTYGRWCHALDPHTLAPVVSRQLPRSRPYNSLLILPDGSLVMKDFAGGQGVHAIGDGDTGSQLVVLDPEGLTILAQHELPEGSIARLSAHPEPIGSGAVVMVVGDQHLHAVRWDPEAGTLEPVGDPRRYLNGDGQTFGWDAVLVDGSAWFLDDGEGTSEFGPSFRGKGVSAAPLHLVRVDLADPASPPQLTEVCGRSGGIVANPPVVDPTRKVVIGYDSGNGVLAGFRYPDRALEPLEPLWRRDQDHAGHLLLDGRHGLVLTYDFDHDRGTDVAVILHVETGETAVRVDTESPVQTVLFPAPGWHDDVYVVSFSTVTRLHRDRTT